MKDSPLPDDASVDDRRLARVERVLRTLGKSDLDEVDVARAERRQSQHRARQARRSFGGNNDDANTCQPANTRPISTFDRLPAMVALRDEYVVQC